MAKIISYSPGIDLALGAADSKHELIMRQKCLRDLDGNVTKICTPESYLQKHKRDYKHTPARGAELAHLNHFGEASRQGNVIVRAYRNPEQASEELRQLAEQYAGRFRNQLLTPNPDPEAPLDKSTGKPRKYVQFNTFVRSIIYNRLRSGNPS